MNFRNRILRLCAVAAVTLAPVAGHAVTAYPYPVEMVMPDGETLTVRICGDEHFHYYVSTDGYVLLHDDAGFLCYAEVDAAGRTVCGAVRAHDAAFRDVAEAGFVKGLDASRVNAAVGARSSEARKAVAAKAAGFTELLTNYPSIGSPKGLVLLVEFSDQRFVTANPHEEFTKLMTEPGYSHNGATGCARDYFVDNSRGMFTPEFDVYGPVTLPHTMSYYGQETGNLHDINPYQMVADACSLLDGEIDFSLYDEDGDGWVDNVFLFYAGYGQNSGAPSYTIWPHAANIFTYGGIRLTLDGVQIGNYACTNELQGNSGSVRTGIGTFCHEFSHVLGLPDLYATDGSSSFTPGNFELMDIGPYLNGGNTPPYMSVYDRMCLSWVNPRELTAGETVVLKAFDDANPDTDDEALIIKTVSDNEYFLLENRQQTGWDAYIPGHGMLVWHIDYDPALWRDNLVNSVSRSQHLRVDIVEADGLADPDTYAGDPFPGVNNVTSFTDNSTPAMKTWTNVKVGKPITNIHEQDGVISFDILGGGERIEAVMALDATDVVPLGFTANWTGRSEIFVYEVDVIRKDEVVPLATFTKRTTSLADCSLAITGLEPSTDYYYVVRAVSGDRKSPNSARVYVTTAAPTFDMYKAVALDAGNVKANSFTARWEPIAGADNYLLSVFTKEYVEQELDIVDFADGLDLPDGWFTNCSKTSGMAGTFGQARPSLCMASDNDLIQSPVYADDVMSLSFWYKAASGTSGSLSVEILGSDGAWSVIDEIDLTASSNAAAREYSSSDVGTDCHGVRLSFARIAGSLYVDDIAVAHTVAAMRIRVDGFDRFAAGNSTECAVDGLTPDTQYFYTVVACSGDLTSVESDEIAVKTASASSVAELPMTGSDVAVSAVGGRIVMANHGGSGCVAVVADVAGRVIASVHVAAGAEVSVAVAGGVYVVKAGGRVTKIAI